MIPKGELFDAIVFFDRKYKALDKELSDEETHTLEKFQEWRRMQEAWGAFQDVVEFKILPFVEQEVKDNQGAKVFFDEEE